MSNESVLVSRIKKRILEEYPNAWVFKVVGSPQQEPGVPDLLVCVDGRLIGLEVKYQRPGESEKHAVGRASALQLQQIERLRGAGAAASVVLSPEEALSVIRSS